jgi:protein TonB
MKKPILVILLFLIFAKFASAQQIVDTTYTGQVFTAVDIEPSYPGGSDKLKEYIQSQIIALHGTDFHEKVILQFIVERNGTLTHLKVLRSMNDDAGDMAIKILTNCPKWNPGIQNGRAVRSYYTLPVKFGD